MVLQSFQSENGLVSARWTTVSDNIWPSILRGAKGILSTYSQVDVIIGSRGEQPVRVDINGQIPMKDMLVVTGQSAFFGGPLKITFYNGSNIVDILYTANLGFAVEYEAISKAFGPFMDSCEIMMMR